MQTSRQELVLTNYSEHNFPPRIQKGEPRDFGRRVGHAGREEGGCVNGSSTACPILTESLRDMAMEPFNRKLLLKKNSPNLY
jgi:hypothetical protein